MRKRTRHIGSGLCSLVSVVIPVFDTLVIIVTEGSYELQKKVTHMMSDRSDRLLSGITKENCSHMKPIYDHCDRQKKKNSLKNFLFIRF